MLKHTNLFLSLAVLFYTVNSYAGSKNKITPSDFSISIPSKANGLILFNTCEIEFQGNSKGFLDIVYTYRKRYIISNRASLDKANFNFVLYNTLSEKESIDIDASTYNLVNNAVAETELTKDKIYEDQIDKHHYSIKCHMPNVKEGSLIDYKVKITSPFLGQINPFTFQDPTFPTRVSSLVIHFPEFLDYKGLSRGSQKYDSTFNNTSKGSFTVRIPSITSNDEVVQLTPSIQIKGWVMKNLNAYEKDDITFSLLNSFPSLRFQLARIIMKGAIDDKIVQSWGRFYEQMSMDDDFGLELKGNHHWSKNNKQLFDIASPLDRTEAIYNHVKKSMAYNNDQSIWLSKKLEQSYQQKRGNCSDINLMLVSMLKEANIKAYAAILSTRLHGSCMEQFPFQSDYNYVIAVAEIDSQYYFMDATDPKLCFGILPIQCYNYTVMALNDYDKTFTKMELSPSLIEDELTVTRQLTLSDDLSLQGEYTEDYGLYSSYLFRKSLSAEKEAKEKWVEGVSSKSPVKINLQSSSIDLIDSLDRPIHAVIKYNTKLKTNNHLLYLNPFQISKLYETDFLDSTRLTPIEFPGKMHYVYRTYVDLSDNFSIDQLPENQIFTELNDNLLFESVYVNLGKRIQCELKITIAEPFVDQDSYARVKQFFQQINQNLNPTIILKQHD